MLVLARDPGGDPGEQPRGLERELDGHVHVVDVDGGRAAGTGCLECGGVVEPRPLGVGDAQRGVFPGREPGHRVEPVATRVLTGEEGLVVAEVLRLDAIGGPAGRETVGVARLVEEVVQRVPRREGQGGREIVAEGVRARVGLEQRVQRLPAVVRAEEHAE